METGVFVEVEAPSRPGEEVCQHYKQTGFCRYGRQCKYDHPAQYRVEKNSIGLPVRPNAPECDYFARQGICKYGQSCRFNHPERYIRKKRHATEVAAKNAAAGGADREESKHQTTKMEREREREASSSSSTSTATMTPRRPSMERYSGDRDRNRDRDRDRDRDRENMNRQHQRPAESYGGRGPRGSQSQRKVYRSEAPGRW